MAVQINIALTDKAGLSVASGSYCSIDVHISMRKFAELQIRFFKNKASFDNVSDPFTPNNTGLLTTYTRQLLDSEYQNLTMIGINQFVQTYLETIFGVGTTTLVQ